MRLSEKLEAADAGSRELDVEIAIAFGWDIPGGGMKPFCEMAEAFGYDWALDAATSHTSIYNTLPAYTTSIDAALTLLPDGWQVDSLSKWDAAPEGADNPSQARSRAYLLETSIKRMGREMIWGHSSNGDRRVEAVSSTPALALCAAICRAKGI